MVEPRPKTWPSLCLLSNISSMTAPSVSKTLDDQVKTSARVQSRTQIFLQ